MIELLNEDNMQVMARYPDKYFDLAIVDPPYGIGFDGYTTNTKGNEKWKNKKAKVYDKKGWDVVPDSEYFQELRRVSKNQIIWGANHFIEKIPFANSPCWVVWDKETNGNFADCELAWTSFPNSVKRFKWLWDGFRKQSPEDRIHPTQKPVQLYRWLLDKYAKAGDKILDTHLGSGSIAIACHDLGFDLVATEIDKEYYEAACKRFSEQTKQLKLIA